jgi:hypothetical protein
MMTARLGVTVAAALFSVLATTESIADSRPSLCKARETAVFSCRVGRKIASLCASEDLGPSSGYLYYAFGNPGRIEASLPEQNLAGRTAISRGGLGFSGGGADYVRIRRGEFAYVIYAAIGKGFERDGVVFERNGLRRASLVCRRDALGKDNWQAVYNAKLAEDRQGFDMP